MKNFYITAIQSVVQESITTLITKGFLILILFLLAMSVSSQQNSSTPIEYNFVYYDGYELYGSDLQGDSINYGTELKIKSNALIEGVECIYHISQVAEDLKIEEGMVLWIGIRSPFNSDWLYLERDLFSDRYNLAILDHNTAEKTIISNEKNGPLQGLVLKPVSWSNHESIVYMEAFKFDAAEEHEGIYTFNLKTGEAHNLNLFTNYMSTPIFSPDRNMFLYSGSSDLMRDQVEGKSDLLFLYDLKTDKEKQIFKAKSGVFVPVGWTTKGDQQHNTLPFDSLDQTEGSIKNIQLLSFNLPWTNGTPYCVSRTGTPPPSGGSSSNYYCGPPYSGYTPHNYVATDFDSPNFVSDNVLAIASGTITTAQNYCSGGGFGKYVILTHTDGTQSLYAHLNSVYVTVSQQVSKGCPLGDGGNTEVPGNNPNCTNPSGGGDHIHFEYRVGGVKQYATFSECNCIPKQAYQYTSSNVIGPCSNTCGVPTGIYASNITSSSAMIYCNPMSGATKYKIGYKPSYNSSYYYYEVTSLPIYLTSLLSNTTYNYKIAAYCPSFGWSNYSPIYSFTTLSGSSGNPCSSVTTISGCGSSYSKTYTSGGTGIWFNNSSNPCSYYSPGIEKIYKFLVTQSGNYNLVVNSFSGGGWVDVFFKVGACSSINWTCIQDIAGTGTYNTSNMYWNAGTTIYLLFDDEDLSSNSVTFYLSCPSSGCPTPTNFYSTNITATSAGIGFTAPNAISFDYYLKPSYSSSYNIYYNYTYNPVYFGNLIPGTTYNFKVKSYCSNGSSPVSSVFSFTTSWQKQYETSGKITISNGLTALDETSYLNEIELFPNPVSAGQFITIEGLNEECILFLYSQDGKLIKSKNIESSQPEFLIPAALTSSVYFVKILNSKGNIVFKKLIVK